MILQETIDKVNNLSLAEVAKDFGVDLKKAGRSYQACCPFHSEKTPSLHISEARSIWKCFGCGAGGVGPISFLQELSKLTFYEAVRQLASRYNIRFETDSKLSSEEYREANRKRESLFAAVAAAHRFYMGSLDDNLRAQDALTSRKFDIDFCKEYGIGATNDNVRLSDWAKRNAVSLEILADAGILKRREDGSIVDRFWHRLMIPIRDKFGRVVSFTGRDISINPENEPPKYLNGEESEIFRKNDCLLFYSEARAECKSKDEVAIAEGPFDVLRLHSLGLVNTVGSMGTNISPNQILLLKGISNVLLCGDTDKPGVSSVVSQGKQLTISGYFVRVLLLINPDEEIDTERAMYYQRSLGKWDPDEFFRNQKILKLCLTSCVENFIDVLANVTKYSGGQEEEILNEVAPCLINMPNSRLELTLNRLKIFVSSKRAWTAKIEELKGSVKASLKIQLNKSEQDIFQKYGFYEADNKYVFNIRNSHVEGSNFVLRPLFHIRGLNSKRMYEMINDCGEKTVIELPQKDMISLQAFNLAVESEGNFVFMGGDIELKKLKKFLYETTDSCREVAQLGWQKEGFYAFSNGVVYKGSFLEIDNLGIVTVGHDKFYLPAYSDIYRDEHKLYVFERQFVHKPGRIAIQDIARLYQEVYGDNGVVSFLFYMSSLFRDIVFYHAKAFPILFLFGAKGTGKSAQAVSLLQFFGELSAGPNINSTTKAALADHLASTSNSIQHIEEYRNDIEVEKREMLKGTWDGTGRSRMNMDKDRKKETTHVDCAVVLSGQQMPTADEALFTRVLFACFTKDTFTEAESKSFNKLKDVEEAGLTHITAQLMEHRDKVKNLFQLTYKKSMEALNELAGTTVVQERLVKNWATIQAIYDILCRFVSLPWTAEQTLKVVASMMLRQSADVSKGNEVGTFWMSVEYMFAEKEIERGVDFVFQTILPQSAKAREYGLTLESPLEVLVIQHTRILPKYAQFGRNTGENTQKRDTIEYYLKNSPEFISQVKSQRFDMVVEDELGMKVKKSVVRTGIAFDYAMLAKSYNISLSIAEDVEVEPIGTKSPKVGGEELPF